MDAILKTLDSLNLDGSFEPAPDHWQWESRLIHRLASSRVCFLTGCSGTGKTVLARAFARSQPLSSLRHVKDDIAETAGVIQGMDRKFKAPEVRSPHLDFDEPAQSRDSEVPRLQLTDYFKNPESEPESPAKAEDSAPKLILPPRPPESET